MAIVIGAATTVSFAGACVISASWGANPNIQRLYCLGSWVPTQQFERPTETLNLTVYSPGPTYDTTPTTACEDANTLSASVSPVSCGGNAPGGVSGNWFVASYSYNKEDAVMPGQESWSMTKWAQGGSGTPLPDFVLRGIADGQSTDPEENTGVVFTGVTTESTTGNVSAGQIGRADTLIMGQVSQVGAGTSDQGELGQGSANMPYTPLWLD